MKQFGLVALMLLVVSCKTTRSEPENEIQTFDSKTDTLDTKLTGTYLGISKYKRVFRKDGPQNPATRIYIVEDKFKKNSYYAILLEYPGLLKTGINYLLSNKAPTIADKVGFLKKIAHKVSVHRIMPTEDKMRFELFPLLVDGGKIDYNQYTKPRQFIVGEDSNKPLAGARILSNGGRDQPKEIYFPKENEFQRDSAPDLFNTDYADAMDESTEHHLQFSIANFVYGKFGLNSTWRHKFLPGPYLAAYNKIGDEVLKLEAKEGKEMAHFFLNDKYHKNSRDRIDVFTNPKSANLEGKFQMQEAADGLFTFKPISGNRQTKDEVTTKIGVFIDVFDAVEKLCQDVVELILVDTKDPTNFHMYYEDPNNGDGTDSSRNSNCSNK